jgi:hypothetical protein
MNAGLKRDAASDVIFMPALYPQSIDRLIDLIDLIG